MRLVSAPAGLRLALAALFICVPMAALEVAIALRAPWWRLPWTDMAWGAGFAFVAWLIVTGLALKTQRWTVVLATGACAAWFLGSLGYALWSRTPGLAFFSSSILLFGSIPFFWLKREVSRSFIDPGIRWYQGLPRPIGSLRCKLVVPSADSKLERECRVSRLDTEGAFIYSEEKKEMAPIFDLKRGKSVNLLFDFRGQELRCTGTPVCALSDGFGAGIQFKGLSPDHQKDLGDFIELLRGEGYVE